MFYNQLRNKNCSGMDALCEKFFILVCMSEDDAALTERAADFFMKHAENPAFIQCMMSGYDYTDNDFFKMLQQRGIWASTIPHSMKLKQLLYRIAGGIRRRYCKLIRN